MFYACYTVSFMGFSENILAFEKVYPLRSSKRLLPSLKNTLYVMVYSALGLQRRDLKSAKHKKHH